MLNLTLTAIASFAAGIGCTYVWRALAEWLTQGRAAYLAFINAMEEPHE